ncbi:uncharacterized protein LOC143035979 [Oratosquilla oratoria]|uniref:uncharacterized protein LOC143035979 n=1 Tax=Oratosquilla oratoria TaxID=337810 RepID=UPI003F772DAE
MWRVLKRFGCPNNYISLVRALHENTSGRVLYQRKLSEEFEITCGLKQCCVLAPTLFALYLAVMMYEIPSDNPGVDIRYRLDSGLFNLTKFRSKQLTTIKTVTEMQYADDNATFCHSADDLQHLLTSKCNSEKDIEHQIAAAYIAFGKLCRRVFDNKDLTRRTKLRVYEAVVVSTLLYGCEA